MYEKTQSLPLAELPRHQEAAKSDEQLLEAFVNRRDEAAFKELMRSHGPMVFGVCKRVLRNHHDAEEAFQATFLILSRKASSIMTRSRVGCWLYGVAYRAALNAKGLRDLRRKREIQAANVPDPEFTARATWAEIAPVLDCEISLLPENFRTAVVLCDLEGKSHKDVARELGWPPGTLSSRLMRARNLLAKRLGQRGFALPVGMLTVFLAQNAASAAVPPSVMLPVAQAVQLCAVKQSFISPNVAQITDGVLKSMLYATTKSIVISLTLTAGILGLASGGYLANQSAAVEPPGAADALEAVKVAYLKQQNTISTLRVDYSEIAKVLSDADEILYKYWRRHSPSNCPEVTAIIGRERAYFREVREIQPFHEVFKLAEKENPDRFRDATGDLSGLIPYHEAHRHLQQIAYQSTERVLACDGKYLRERSPHSLTENRKSVPVYFVKDATKEPQSYGQIQSSLLDFALRGFRSNALPADTRQRRQFRIPDLFSEGDYAVAADSEVIDGAECLVIESPQRDKLWLDPKLAYALRSREQMKDGQTFMTARLSDFVEVAAEVWIPKTVVLTEFGDSRVPQSHQGKPLLEITWTASNVEANLPAHDKMFILQPEAGATVMDMTLPLDDSNDLPKKSEPVAGDVIPVFSYTQPSDPSKVGDAIRTARESRGAKNGDLAPRKSTYWPLFIWLNVVVIAIAVIATLLQKRYRK